MRFINSYLNIDFGPNVAMKTVYIDTFPHLVIICMKDIDIGEEFLLDYGDAYNQAYLTPKPPVIPYSNNTESSLYNNTDANIIIEKSNRSNERMSNDGSNIHIFN